MRWARPGSAVSGVGIMSLDFDEPHITCPSAPSIGCVRPRMAARRSRTRKTTARAALHRAFSLSGSADRAGGFLQRAERDRVPWCPGGRDAVLPLPARNAVEHVDGA